MAITYSELLIDHNTTYVRTGVPLHNEHNKNDQCRVKGSVRNEPVVRSHKIKECRIVNETDKKNRCNSNQSPCSVYHGICTTQHLQQSVPVQCAPNS